MYATSDPWLGRTVRISARGEIAFPRGIWTFRDGRQVTFFNDAARCRPTNETPVGAIKQFLVSFATQDTAALARLLSADYRFSSTDLRFVRRFPTGLDRAAQLDSVAGLPATPPNRDRDSGKYPRLSLFAEFPDTIIAHSPAPAVRASQTIALRLLLICAVSDDASTLLADSAACTFLLVRGDSANVPCGAPADTEHWYVARWHSEAFPVGAGDRIDSLAHATSPATGESTPVFGVLRESGLHESPVTFALSLPDPIDARVEVFDLRGRRILSRTVANRVSAVRRFRLGERDLEAGLYWLRVSHGRRQQVTKFVVLR